MKQEMAIFRICFRNEKLVTGYSKASLKEREMLSAFTRDVMKNGIGQTYRCVTT